MWLSGAIPEEAQEQEKQEIRAFVRALAKEVWSRGGTLVHGSQPDVTRELLAVAEERKRTLGDRQRLVLVISRQYSKRPTAEVDLDAWNALCREPVIETREALRGEEEELRGFNLKILREMLREQTNVFVAVGGRWWKEAQDKAGVREEIEFAKEAHMPLFLMGGLPGATQGYLEQHPGVLEDCRNGRSSEWNFQLKNLKNAGEMATRVVDQIAQLPLPAKAPFSGRPFRILCLDGGGIRGAFTAAVLREWEQSTEMSIVDHFDLIAGTSTGGILATGLGLGLSAARMLKFYEEDGPDIFPIDAGLGRMRHSLRHWFSAKFERKTLEKKLTKAFEPFMDADHWDEAKTRLLVAAYNSEIDAPLVFRTPHGPLAASHRGRNPIQVALASAAAPTFFDPVQIGDIKAIDGGVWANSPTAIALAEATSELEVDPQRIEMLSIGTTSSPTVLGQPITLDKKMIRTLLDSALPRGFRLLARPVSWFWRDRTVQGKLGWLPHIASFLMKTQSQTADYVCQRVLGKRFLRVDAVTEEIELDEVSAINTLIGKGREVAQAHAEEVRTRFLNNVPARAWK